jgi:tetratricopeptide (TPR) repeat protein
MVTKSAFMLSIALVLSLPTVPLLSAQTQETDLLIRFYQGRVSRDPDDFFNYNKLTAAYLQKARETGDVTYYELAEKAVRKSLALVSGQPATAALTYLAAVFLAKHEFHDALAQAQQAIALGGEQTAPYAIVGDAYLEMGEYEQAAAAYEKMRTPREERTPYSRLSYLQFLRGDAQGAIQLMNKAVAAASANNAPKEHLVWSQAQLGETLFAVGNVSQAETAYHDALVTYPAYHPALAGLAKVRSAQQRDQEAIEFYQQAIAVIPLLGYVAALGDLYAKIGNTEDAKKQYKLVEYIGHLNTLNQTLYSRELALFYADHEVKLQEALPLAERELEVRQDIYTDDVLAWTLYKNEKPQEALTIMTRALRLGTKDARLFFHAGMIYHRVGKKEEAKNYLRQALTVNPHFHPTQADVAERMLKELESPPGAAAAQE